MKLTKVSRNGRGRPRSFDSEKALDRALQVFWKQGYEGTSISDLTAAMNINRPSLYAAFGNKEALFDKVLERYIQGPGSYVTKALLAPTAREFVEELLTRSADFFTDQSHACGCMSLNAGLALNPDNKRVRQLLKKRQAAREVLFVQRFKRALAEGDLPAGSDPSELADYVSVIFQGLAVQAAGGATRKDLQKVVGLVLSNWPPRITTAYS